MDSNSLILEGKIPFDYPVSDYLDADIGDFVLSPPLLWIEEGFSKGGDKQSFIYYGGYLKEISTYSSIVENLTKKESIIPNSMIIPIKKGVKAEVGSIILTHWESGSGMQRAIVIEGGTEEEPMVRYLDLDYENPAGVGKKSDRCKKNRFHLLEKEYQIGTSIAEKDGVIYKHWQILNIIDDKILALGFANKIKVIDKTQTIPIPIKYIPTIGETVFVVVMTSFKKGVVVDIDEKIGRVFVEYDFGNKKEIKAFPFGKIIKELP
ncbi:hypothetical protein JXR93_06030 [bacterium]|nr:hypothetical protein [bacterium]